MRRDSRLAAQIVPALQAQGLDLTARRLERWCADGLGPKDRPAAVGGLIAHFVAVAALASSGRDADVVAMRLAARGHPCPRLRGALLRRLGIAPTAPPFEPVVLDLTADWSSEEQADPIFEVVEARARAAASVGHPFFQRLRGAMLRNAQRHVNSTGETAEEILHSLFVSIGWVLAGGELYNTQAWAAAFNLDGVDDEEFAGLMEALRPNQACLENEYRIIPLGNVAAIAAWLVGAAPEFLNHIGARDIPEAELEEWCCAFAPYAAHVVALLEPRLGQFGRAEVDLAEAFREYLKSRRERSRALVLEVARGRGSMQLGG